MIFNRPIWAPNVIMVDLPDDKLKKKLPEIMRHIGLDNQLVGINAMSDELELESRKITIHQEDYEIYRELLSDSHNPSTILLKSKAKIVYYVDADVESCKAAFAHMYDLIEDDYPIICLSHILPNHVNSAVVICDNVSKYTDKKSDTVAIISIDEFTSYNIYYNEKKFKIADQ